MEKNNKDLINYTIIIPHYNIPKLLRRCLCSIPKRDDTQVIVVDDKSTDDNIAFLGTLEKEFPHVEFIYSNINGGGGKARNIGLKKARGKFVLFADADDFFNYCINDVLDEYNSSNYDIVFFHATHIDTYTYLPTDRVSTMMRAIDNYKDTGNDQFLRFLFDEPWSKLIKREFLIRHDIYFEESPIHNDMRFSYMSGFYAKEIKLDERSIYTLADRTNSVSKGISDDKQEIRTKIMCEKNRFLELHGIHLFDDIMLLPFEYYMKQRNYGQLERCYNIAKDYGYGKSKINYLLIKTKWQKMRKVMAKVFFVLRRKLGVSMINLV